MTPRPDDPFVIPADELDPVAATPADAPPPPDDELPQGEAMLTVTRLAARPRRGGPFWTVLGALLSLVISIAAYDYLMGLLARYPLLGKLALVLTALLALMVLGQVDPRALGLPPPRPDRRIPCRGGRRPCRRRPRRRPGVLRAAFRLLSRPRGAALGSPAP